MWSKERKLLLELLEPRELLAADISLVRYFDTWGGGTIKSTDPAGLTYHPGSGHLYIADSEINELPEIFTGKNIFEVSLRGDVVHREIASFNAEPTGITYSEFDGFFYVTNDDTHSIYRYDDNLNLPLASIDARDATPDAYDPEGIASDPLTGMLYVVDGKDGGMQVLVYDSTLQFRYRFSIATEMQDGEGIAFNPVRGSLLVVSNPDRGVFEYERDGTFVRKYDLGGISPGFQDAQGLTFAPTSDPDDDPNELSHYIADGMVDNYPDGRIFEVAINPPDSGLTTFEARIAASSDDAEERANGWVTTTSSDLELVHDSSDQVVGLRFVALAVPPGASIVNAYVQFQVDQASSGQSSLVIQGESTDDAALFGKTDKNISSRPRTSASIAWSPPDWTTVGEAGLGQRTPELASVIQEIINRPGWAAGNALALVITGTGVRVAEAYDGKSNAAPLLHVEYVIGGEAGPIASSFLLVTNQLNRGVGEAEIGGAPMQHTLDVDGDRTLGPLDALLVRNYLNRQSAAPFDRLERVPLAERGSATPLSSAMLDATDAFFHSLGGALGGLQPAL